MENFEKNKNYSEELEQIFNADQDDRGHGLDETGIERDKERLIRAREIYQEYKNGNAVLSPEDLYHLAFVFHHSPSEVYFDEEGNKLYVPNSDREISLELAKQSADAGFEEAKWLSAAAEDRVLRDKNQRQVWGTQFTDEHGIWEYDPVLEKDEVSGINDDMRKERNVPVRNEQLSKIAEKYKDIP